MNIIAPKRTDTRDKCIRAPLIEWLRKLHPEDGSCEVLQELKMPRPSARIDVALVNGEIAGYEIKSDFDTLHRLTGQIPAFSRFFDRVSIVTTKKHFEKAKVRLPLWWGIILYDGDGIFKIQRKGRRNTLVDVNSLLYALSVSELADLACLAGRPMSKTKKSRMVDAIASHLSSQEVGYHARELLRRRVTRLLP